MSFTYWYSIAGIALTLAISECSALATGGSSAAVGGFDGTILVAWGTSSIVYGKANPHHSLYLMFGGPSVKFKFADLDFTISFSLLPSLRYIPNMDPVANIISFLLGAGPSFKYEKWILTLPIYIPSSTQTDVAIGIGYQL